jgi:uncharacterized protein involved in exopolysaccharide biosynthesis
MSTDPRGGGVPTPAPRALTVDEVVARADALDQRRQQQITLQRRSIDRLLRTNGDLAPEVVALTNELAELRARHQAAIDVLVSTGRKPSPISRSVLAILDPQEPPPVL